MTNKSQTTQNSGKHLSLTIKCKVEFRQDSDSVYYKQASSHQFQYFTVSSHDMHLILVEKLYGLSNSTAFVNTESINKGLVLYTCGLT